MRNDLAGNREGEWVTRFERWAGLQFLKGGEDTIADRITGLQPVIITVRYDENTRQVSSAWRAVDKNTGISYNIGASADFQQKRQYLDMMAQSGGPDG